MIDIKAIFFDLDETLIENRLAVKDVFRRLYFDFSDQLGDENETVFFNELRHHIQTLWTTMFDTQVSPERQLITCLELSISATKSIADSRQLKLAQDMLDHFLFLSANNVQFQDNAEWVLEQLNAKGFTTGIITNGMESVQLGKIQKLDLANRVDSVTVSAQARAHKPLRPVFELALQRTNVSSTESLMIGDHPTNDVAGGIRAGFTGVYYNPKKHALDVAFAGLEENPDHMIDSLSEVINLVQSH